MIEETFGDHDISLEIADKVEEQVLGFKVVMTRAIIAVAHDQYGGFSNLIKLGPDIVTNITSLGRKLNTSLGCLRQVVADQVILFIKDDFLSIYL